MCYYAAQKKKIDIERKYNEAIVVCKEFISGKKTDISDVILSAIFFAKLEHTYRKVAHPFDIDINYILNCEEEIVNDLIALAGVFEEKFVVSGLITSESKVIYNPTFGGASVICGGADADIFIDGTLYDFKCTKKTGYVWNEAAQILAYFLLDVIAKKSGDTDNCLNGFEIKRIALYRARYGEIEFVDIKDSHYQLANVFEEILGKEHYVEFLANRKREDEKERLKQEKFEEEYRKQEKQIERGYKKLLTYIDGSYFDETLDKIENKVDKLKWMKCAVLACYNEGIEDKIDGKKLKLMIEKRNICMEELERKLNRKKATIRNWIEEKNNPSLGIFIDLTEVLDCEISDIIKESERHKKEGKAEVRKRIGQNEIGEGEKGIRKESV